MLPVCCHFFVVVVVVVVLLVCYFCCCCCCLPVVVFFVVVTVVTCSPLLLLEGISHVLKVLFGLLQLPFSTAESITIDINFCLGYIKLGRVEK